MHNLQPGILALYGHIGSGHIHSHSGLIQDDSAGFTVLASMIKKELPIQTNINKIDVNVIKNTITIQTIDGGTGFSTVQNGITPFEAKMMESALYKDAIFIQKRTLETFGKIYGQGAMEVAVAFQTALALAILNTFQIKWPNKIIVTEEDVQPNIGKILGTTIKINELPISCILTINASEGGIGPNEDQEGNIPLGKKGELMQRLGSIHLPSIIIESKCYIKDMNIDEPTFYIRANEEKDNITVARSLISSAKESRLPYLYNFQAYERYTNDFKETTVALVDTIMEQVTKLKETEDAANKVSIVANLIKLLREDAGGFTFMSNDIQSDFGSAGMIQGTAAVLSLLVTQSYMEQYKIPFITEDDIENYHTIISNALLKLSSSLEEAKNELHHKFHLPNNFT